MSTKAIDTLDDGRAAETGTSFGAMVSTGAQMLQIRTEKQLLVAIQRPRNEEDFANALYREASEAGEDFFYSIPYKDHRPDCNNRKGCDCPKTLVEGPGVGLARSAARTWGNCSVDTSLEQEFDDAWLVGAWFVDFETNFTKHETKRVSKMRATKGGRMVRAADRELDVVYQQGASKVERDVILRALPRHVIERAFELAKYAALLEKMPIKDQIARLVRRFHEIDVTLAQVENYLGCTLTEEGMAKAEKNPRETCAHLRGLITAIKGGELEVAEVFGPAITTAGPVTEALGAVSLADLEGKPVVDYQAMVEKWWAFSNTLEVERRALEDRHQGDAKSMWAEINPAVKA